MRVLYLTDSLSELDGVGRYAMGLIRALEAEVDGFEADVLLARKHRLTSATVPARWNARVALPPDYFFYMTRARFWASLVPAVWRAWRAARKADLVHAIKDYPHSLVALLAARLAGKPCIATAHGTYTVQPLLDPRHARLARWCYARFSAMIAVSGYTARRMREVLGRSAARLEVHTIPNCVELGPLEAHVDVGERPWHHFRFTLGMGETKERKGHHVALAAFAEVARRHADLHHVIVGKLYGDAYEARLRGIVEEAGVAERVHFLGNVDEAVKVDLMQRCTAFVHTPVTAADGGFEGFGIVYLEASACGKPVLGTTGCGAEDAIVDGVTGFLAAPEPAAVADALERIVADAQLAERLGREGRAFARANTWEKNARAVAALYRGVLA